MKENAVGSHWEKCCLWVLLTALALCKGMIAFLMPFKSDELLHLHNAWMVARGALPYRDFFDHHACWYHLFLAPLFQLGLPERGATAAVRSMVICRSWSLLLSLATICLVWRIGWKWKSLEVGLVAAILMSSVSIFLKTGSETRPDVPALLLWTGCLCLILPVMTEPVVHSGGALRPVRPTVVGDDMYGPRYWGAFTAGVCLGSGIMFTQKLLFVLPGMLLAMALWCGCGFHATKHRRLYVSFGFYVGVVLPVLLTWLWFVCQQAGLAFLDNVFLINARWAYHRSSRMIEQIVWNESFVFVTLGVVGIVYSWLAMNRERITDWPSIVLQSTIFSWLAGLWWVIPVADLQFFLIPLPAIALLASRAVLGGTRMYPRWIAMPLSATIMIWATVPPVCRALGETQKASEISDKLHRITWIIENTRTSDSILDAWTGMGVFRPPAWYYGFVHQEIPPMIPPADREKLMRDLESGRIQPKIVANDPALLGLHPRLRPWVHMHYEFNNELGAFMRSEPDKPRSDVLAPAAQPAAASLNTESRPP